MGTCYSQAVYYHENYPEPEPEKVKVIHPKYPDLTFDSSKKTIENTLEDLIFFSEYPEEYLKMSRLDPTIDQSLQYIIENRIILPKFKKESKLTDSHFTIQCHLNIDECLKFMFEHNIPYLFNIHLKDWLTIVQLYESHGMYDINAAKLKVSYEGPINGRRDIRAYLTNNQPYYMVCPLLILDKESKKIITDYFWDFEPVDYSAHYYDQIQCYQKSKSDRKSIAQQFSENRIFKQCSLEIKKEETAKLLRRVKEKDYPAPESSHPKPLPLAPPTI